MATLAPDWTLGVMKCENCGYKWNAACENGNLPGYDKAMADIVTGRKGFQCECPKCGKKNCQMVEILGA